MQKKCKACILLQATALRTFKSKYDILHLLFLGNPLKFCCQFFSFYYNLFSHRSNRLGLFTGNSKPLFHCYFSGIEHRFKLNIIKSSQCISFVLTINFLDIEHQLPFYSSNIFWLPDILTPLNSFSSDLEDPFSITTCVSMTTN